MLDLKKKSAMKLVRGQVSVQARHRNFEIGRGLNQIIQHIVGDG